MFPENSAKLPRATFNLMIWAMRKFGEETDSYINYASDQIVRYAKLSFGDVSFNFYNSDTHLIIDALGKCVDCNDEIRATVPRYV